MVSNASDTVIKIIFQPMETQSTIISRNEAITPTKMPAEGGLTISRIVVWKSVIL